MEARRRERRINRERISKAGMKRYKNKEGEILKLKAERETNSRKRRKCKTGKEESDILKFLVNSLASENDKAYCNAAHIFRNYVLFRRVRKIAKSDY